MILAVDGREVEDPKALNFRLAIGDARQGRQARRLAAGPHRRASACRSRRRPIDRRREPTTLDGRQVLAGATVANLSPGLDKDLDLDLFKRGVVVLKVARGSPAAAAPPRARRS